MRWQQQLRRPLVPLAGVAVTLACSGSNAPNNAPASSASAASFSSPDWEVLPSRALVVARADRWAVQGAEHEGVTGARWTERAARLRERMWRLEGREADALEARELYDSAAQRSWQGACEAGLGHALLGAELKTEPARVYLDLYRLRAKYSGGACADRIATALGMLQAYRPSASVLATLDENIEPKRGSGAGRTHHVERTRTAQVVVPHEPLQSAPARITKVERYGAEESARLVVFMTHPTLFKVGVLEAQPGRGPRVYLDIERSSYAGRPSFEVGGLVERVRLGSQGTATRLVLDLSTPVFHRVFYLPEPFRLIIDVSKTPPAEPAQPSTGKRSVKRIVLDPGHGGHDPGAIGPSGLREKDVTLDIAHRAAPLVARELGISTLLTRDTDDFVPLAERTARANAFQADLFISIHCNASEEPGSEGLMTFILDESRDALASQIAARENDASQAAAAELANVMSRVLGAGSVQESLHFAELLQRAAMASVRERYPKVRDHGVKRAGFYVLAGAQMPSVLYEASFISNPHGEVRLNTGDFRQKMADAIVNAVRAYREGL